MYLLTEEQTSEYDHAYANSSPQTLNFDKVKMSICITKNKSEGK